MAPTFYTLIPRIKALADDIEKPDQAVILLDQLRANRKRRDLVNDLREASDRYRKQVEGADQ
jgi:hypothetical protein